MNKLNLITASLAVSLLGSGCSTVNNTLAEKKKSVELYRIFNIQTNADRYAVTEAASDGLGGNVNNADEQNPIPNYTEKPVMPGRYKSVNPMKQMQGQLTGFAAFAASQMGPQLKTVDCDGAIWTAKATKKADNAFNMSFNLCMWEYQGGYHLDVYANYTKEEGGLYSAIRNTTYAIMGTPEEWAEKTVLDIVREIKSRTGAQVKFNEGYPKLNTTPWLDSGMVFNAEGYLGAPVVASNTTSNETTSAN
ncbi:hypothetical protein RI844_03055 [Thalassotalea fonticola]|uniref:Lipoprotein n=1 Tax=Thalassotalea fonticola TaxID=3065649 RepID=A0ABZ0GQZ9_9GAMM|nr:hypothetical protein RI844_03055 [Colwelliaceae bacterium S1-1]